MFWQANTRDAAGNVLTETLGNGLSTTRTMEYNALGNITYKSDVGSGTYTYPSATSARPHAVSSISGTVHGLSNPNFVYDANGNLTEVKGSSGTPCSSPAAGERCLTYMSWNMPQVITGKDASGNSFTYTYTYAYNGEHERVKLVTAKSAGNFTSIYLHPAGAGQLLYEKETDPSSVVEHKHYVQAGGMLVGVYVTVSSGTSPGMRYYHRDNLGSIVRITNEAGAAIEALGYEAFGKRRYANGSADSGDALYGMNTDRGFTGHEHLEELTLVHMNGRVYEPLLGRFMTADPFVQSPEYLQSYNRYSYGFNNPLSGTDPSGYGFVDDVFDFVSGTLDAVLDNPVRTAITIGVAYYTGQWIGDALATGSAAEWSLSSITFSGGTASYTFTAAGYATIGAGTGFTLGTISGGDLQSGVRGAASGALLGGVDGYYGRTWNLERVAVKATAAGLAARIQGGRFEDGFLNAGLTSGTRYLYNNMVGYDVTAAPGENRPGRTRYEFDTSEESYGRLYPSDRTRNIVLYNENYDGTNSCFFCKNAWTQGSPLSKALNAIPGINAIAGLDDYLNNRLSPGVGDSGWFKTLTVPASVIGTVPALFDRIPIYQPHDPFGRRR